MGEGGTSADGQETAPDGPRDGPGEPTRSDIRTEEQAARHGWEIPQADRTAIINRLTGLAKDPKARPRTALSAARAVGAFAKLDIEEKKAGLVSPEPTPEKDPNDIDARDLLRERQETEWYRQEWIRNVKSRYSGSSSPSPTPDPPIQDRPQTPSSTASRPGTTNST